MIVGDLSLVDWRRRLAGGPSGPRGGVTLAIGPFVTRLTVRLPEVAEAMHFLYRDYPLLEAPAIHDFDVAALPMRRLGTGPRKATLHFDGLPKFDPIERDQALPMFEWLLNWCIFTHPHQYLILHAAVVARDGLAAILPGMPGAGKSTLCTALVHRGWRLLSDEVALVTPATGLLTAAPLPIGLKEESIPLIRAAFPEARIGPPVRGTRKGTVAHIAPPASSMAAVDQPARPRWIIFPEYQPHASLSLEPTPRANALMTIAADAFNYSLLGATGFETLANVVESCDCFGLRYSKLEDAIAAFEELALSEPRGSVKSASAWVPHSIPKGAVCAGQAPENQGQETCSPSVKSQQSMSTEHAAPVGGKSDTQHPVGMLCGTPRRLLLNVLAQPRRMAQLDTPAHNELLRQARMSKLVARLGCLAQDANILDDLPAKMVEQFTAARAVADQHARIVRWEVNRVAHALRQEGVDCPVVLLKGAAYLLAGLDVARGRLVTDVDILVPASRLSQVEVALLAHGWESMKVDPYDQRYYRAWMHELPPLKHTTRHSVLDVHHTILPVTGRLSPDPRLLLADARDVRSAEQGPSDARSTAAGSRIQVLAPADMLLHAAVHMFQDGELAGAVRDLADIAAMIAAFASQPDFWPKLVPRADQLGLQRPLYYALASARDLLAAPVPDSVMQALKPARPSWPVRKIMAHLIARAIVPQPPLRQDLPAATARLALYTRSHWLRMPPRLLVGHLYEKATRRWRRDKDES